uniref:Uncharacterized protein n=1 Tax=Nelumbo nucifera TaxID=4432 RepID=A0A822ZZ36_NELNU|nr:TPA_asm: hypothetical protein HUJ06_018023 [Nelumbo nucifera]
MMVKGLNPLITFEHKSRQNKDRSLGVWVMEGGGGGNGKVSTEEVIAKLKDDGDFDKLRLKIIRKLKEKEDLRNCIISMVKQSAALNHARAENLKPRQLCDAVHEEIRDQVMGQISDGLWEVIKSNDGMKSEITDTVQSVYNKLVNLKGKELVELSSPSSTYKKVADNGTLAIPTCKKDDTSGSEPKEPPGFFLCNHCQGHEEEQTEVPNHPEDASNLKDGEPSVPPGFAAFVDRKQLCDGNDEDPDVPPGFG